MLFNELVADNTADFAPRFGKETSKMLDEFFKPEITSTTKVGIEIEVENVVWQSWKTGDAALRALYDSYWTIHEDGSLRNNGMEFVTRIGQTASQASSALKILEAAMARIAPKATANARTGVHIHLNFLDKTAKDVGAFLALYVLFEKSLFEFSGSRVQNIFCVPVRDSQNVVGNMIRCARKDQKNAKNIWTLARASPKYLACNVGALGNLGTIELRHAGGTNRPTTVLPWLETVIHLYDFAAKQDLEPLLERIRDLNTNSLYEALMKEALPRFVIKKLGEPAIVQDMINGCAYLKEALIAPEGVGVAPFVQEPPPLPPPRRDWLERIEAEPHPDADELPPAGDEIGEGGGGGLGHWSEAEAMALGYARFPDTRFRLFARRSEFMNMPAADAAKMLVDLRGRVFFNWDGFNMRWIQVAQTRAPQLERGEPEAAAPRQVVRAPQLRPVGVRRRVIE